MSNFGITELLTDGRTNGKAGTYVAKSGGQGRCFMQGLFVLRFYGPVNPMGSCRERSVYLTTRLLGRHSPLSG